MINDFNELITNIVPYWQPHFPCNEYLQIRICYLSTSEG